MSNLSEHTNNAEQFEDLLKDAFLDLDLDDPKNEELIDALSMSVMTPVMVQQPKSKGLFKRFIGKISLQSVLFIGLAIISLIIGFKWCEKANVTEKNKALIEEKPDSIIQQFSKPVITEKRVKVMPEKEVVNISPQQKFQVKTQQHAKNISVEQRTDTAAIIVATEGNNPDSVKPFGSAPPVTIKTTDAVSFGF
ncbi:MAG: hypothetical protein ABUL44_04630, partial [Flavobacterium sp.]